MKHITIGRLFFALVIALLLLAKAHAGTVADEATWGAQLRAQGVPLSGTALISVNVDANDIRAGMMFIRQAGYTCDAVRLAWFTKQSLELTCEGVHGPVDYTVTVVDSRPLVSVGP